MNIAGVSSSSSLSQVEGSAAEESTESAAEAAREAAQGPEKTGATQNTQPTPAPNSSGLLNVRG